jgi:hypothetical protein
VVGLTYPPVIEKIQQAFGKRRIRHHPDIVLAAKWKDGCDLSPSKDVQRVLRYVELDAVLRFFYLFPIVSRDPHCPDDTVL